MSGKQINILAIIVGIIGIIITVVSFNDTEKNGHNFNQSGNNNPSIINNKGNININSPEKENKKESPSYDKPIIKYEDIISFNNFIDSHKNQIVYLEVYLIESELIKYVNHPNSSAIILNESSDCTGVTSENKDNDWCYRRVYSFFGKEHWVDEDPNVDFGIKGYFIIPRNNKYHEGHYMYDLDGVSSAQVLLSK